MRQITEDQAYLQRATNKPEGNVDHGDCPYTVLEEVDKLLKEYDLEIVLVENESSWYEYFIDKRVEGASNEYQTDS